MAEPAVEIYSDLHCPHAYLLRFHLRRWARDRAEELTFRSRCLAIEIDQDRPTPKPILDTEGPLIGSLEPELPYEPWPEARLSAWPVTFLPAFEAVKVAERIDPSKAWALDWRIRRAFYEEHACVSMRNVLADLAEEVGLDRERFLDAWDGGDAKRSVIQETREGWYERGFPVSPTVVLPNGEVHVNPLGVKVHMDPDRNWRVTRFETGVDDRQARLDGLLGGIGT